MAFANTESTQNDVSHIQEFFRDSTVFVTGGTGFLGNVLLEKLLRSCPGLKKIYILTREKKGKDSKERIKEMFDNVIFERMKVACPDYITKVTPINGDCEKPNLGIGETERNIIINEVDTIFHVAATVRFDAPIRNAVDINVRATRDILDIAHSAKHLKAFVHVSTAYSNCAERETVAEQFYNTPVSYEDLIKVTNSLSDTVLGRITPKLIEPWPNTYAFTKAIAEDVVRSKGKGLPVTVVRPAIVIATAQEPVAGWINNFYGPTGVVFGAGLGLLHSIHADGDCIAELVPCDKVVNAIITAAWDVAQTREKPANNKLENGNKTNEMIDEIPIYNYVSSNAKPLRWKEYMAYNELAEPEIPTSKAIWLYYLTLNKYKFMHHIYCVFMHLLPALLIDSYARLVGKEPRLWGVYVKIHKFSEVIAYFSTKQWRFVDKNTVNLCRRLTPKDRDLFDFDLTRLDWKEYFYYHIRGIRVYLAQDPMDTVKDGLKLRKKLMWAHYALKSTLYCLFLYILLRTIRFIF